jgi:hypothetical protein
VHCGARFRPQIAVDVQSVISSELPDVVGAVSEENEGDPRQTVEPIRQAVLSTVDVLSDGLGVAFIGSAVKPARVPVEQ